MYRLLFITNRRLSEPGGRPEKFRARRRFLANRGWKMETKFIPAPHDVRSAKSLRAIVECLLMAKTQNFDLVNSISEPPQLHIVGYLASQIADVPWLMEFRDPLAINPQVDFDSLAGRFRRELESLLVPRADKIVWDDGIQLPDDYFANNYPGISEDSWVKLPYIGFEREKFQKSGECSFDSFTVTYAGSFREGWIEPYGFLKGLSIFKSRYPEADIDVRFYGDWNPRYQSGAERENVADIISVYDEIDYDKLIPILKGSDVSLYVGGEAEKNKLNIASKMYDYIGANNPILAVVDESFRAAQFVRENELGVVASPSNPSAIASALSRLYEGKGDIDLNNPEQFSRTRKMDALAGVLNRLVE